MSGSIAAKRAGKEIRMLAQAPPGHVAEISLVDDNILHWSFTVLGPAETPYAGGRFKCECTLSEEYPNVPPTVKITTPIFNPNVDDGKICDGLFAHWAPTLGMKDVMDVIAMVFTDFSHGAVNEAAAKLFQTDKKKFAETAKSWTLKYAK